MNIEKGRLYRRLADGGTIEVVSVARMEETGEAFVVYRSFEPNFQGDWICTLSEFNEGAFIEATASMGFHNWQPPKVIE